MAWWGKLIGGAFGFMLGGPLGALLGATVGHNLDKGMANLGDGEPPGPGDRERVQTAFFTATFSVMGNVAKVDGRVSEREIAMAQALMAQMELSQDMRRTAIRLFNEGKAPQFQLDEVLEQFRRECHRRQTLIQMFMEIQLQAAYADAALNYAEERLLLYICERLGFSTFVFRRLEQLVRLQHQFADGQRGRAVEPKGPTLDDAYSLLGVAPQASDGEVKRAYRRLLSQHHPDKLVAKGLPEEMMKLATQKTHEIRQAYELVKDARGM